MAKDGLRFLGETDDSPVNCTCDILDKKSAIFHYIQYMFDRTNTMFRYKGLPDTIPEPMLEYMLQIYGSVAVLEDGGDLYVFRGRFGGPPDPYYRPTFAVIANPGLNLSGNYRIVNHLPPAPGSRAEWSSMKPCVRFLNDSQIQGLLPLFARYATQMAENDVSIRSAQINLRQTTVIAADNGPTVESAIQYTKSIEEGRLSVIAKQAFLDGVTVTNTSSGNSNIVTQLLELQQYLKASWYNEIGLNPNFNMKSQYVSSEEINANADIMLPLVDNMFEQRKMALEAINKEFGTNITVEKDSAWEKKQLQSDIATQEAPDESKDESSTVDQTESPEESSPVDQNEKEDNENA